MIDLTEEQTPVHAAAAASITGQTESITFKAGSATRRLLVAFAHPDDESFGPAGTFIHYASQGVAVHYVCGTRGEAGTVDPACMTGFETIAALRTHELYQAAQTLGLTGLHFLNYHDSGMENSPDNDNPHCLFQAPLEKVTAQITALIRQIRPQVVVTFDPSGGYFHPDHIKMHQAATAAFHAAGDPTRYPEQLGDGLQPYQPQKLYYTAFTHTLAKVMVKLMPLFGQDPTALGRNNDINLKRIVSVDNPITTRINVNPYYEQRLQAADCHASQQHGGWPSLPTWLRRYLSRHDTYTRVEPPPYNGSRETDLFAGVTD